MINHSLRVFGNHRACSSACIAALLIALHSPAPAAEDVPSAPASSTTATDQAEVWLCNELSFNLIVNSQEGGKESDERFYLETLRMTDTYLKAGGRPNRWFVQSWYPFPKQMVPERMGIDPRRIALKGRSSGGHVALMVGFGPDRKQPESADRVQQASSIPTCIVAGSAPTDLPLQMGELFKNSGRRDYLRKRMQALVGVVQDDLSVDELLERLKPLSPIEYVTKQSPPVMLIHHGPADAYWPGDDRLSWDVHTPITGLILAKQLESTGVPHELVMVPEGRERRGNVGPVRELSFLRKYLMGQTKEAGPQHRGSEAE